MLTLHLPSQPKDHMLKHYIRTGESCKQLWQSMGSDLKDGCSAVISNVQKSIIVIFKMQNGL